MGETVNASNGNIMNNPWLKLALIITAWDDLLRADLACGIAWFRLKYAELRRYLLALRLQRLIRRIQSDPQFARRHVGTPAPGNSHSP
jgi:hypothetical protein